MNLMANKLKAIEIQTTGLIAHQINNTVFIEI
jgi:hypothetical protein